MVELQQIWNRHSQREGSSRSAHLDRGRLLKEVRRLRLENHLLKSDVQGLKVKLELEISWRETWFNAASKGNQDVIQMWPVLEAARSATARMDIPELNAAIMTFDAEWRQENRIRWREHHERKARPWKMYPVKPGPWDWEGLDEGYDGPLDYKPWIWEDEPPCR